MPIKKDNSLTLKTLVSAILLASIASMTACHSDNGYYGEHAPVGDTDTGATPLLVKSSFVKELSGEELITSLATLAPDLHAVAPPAKCDVVVKKYTFNTFGVEDDAIKSTAALMLPKGDAAECQGDRPIFLYAHGTVISKDYDMSQVADATKPAGGLSAGVAANFAAQGYIVVAPNYAGYDESELDYHPYLNAKQQSHEMADALNAAKELLAVEQEYSASDKLFISGVSQGGHVALATARHFDAIGQSITATAPISGPYSMTAFGDTIFNGEVNLGATVFAPMLAVNYNKDYGNIYNSPSDILTEQYAPNLEGLIPNTDGGFMSFLTSGKVPMSALFEKNPTGRPLLEGISPADPSYDYGFDETNYLIRTDFREAYIKDAIANPDGYISNSESALPPADPKNSLRQALKLNDLRLYLPKSPVMLCGGNRDPMVFFDTNVEPVQKIWQNQSDSGKKLNVMVLDVDALNTDTKDHPRVTYIGDAKELQTALEPTVALAHTKFEEGFFEAKGSSMKYHSNIVTPACFTAARGYFEQFKD